MANLMPKWLTWFLKIFFKLLYNQFAWGYDIVSWMVSVGMWNDWIRVVLPFIQGSKILELGFGTGHLQQALYEIGQTPFGLDISKNMGKICRRRLKKIGYEARLVNGSGSRLPYPSNIFDQILATFPTEYIVESGAIKEIFRTLIPGGELIIIPEAKIMGNNIIYRASAWLFKVTGQTRDEGDDRIYQQGKKLFEGAGFGTKLDYIYLPNSRVTIFKAIKPSM